MANVEFVIIKELGVISKAKSGWTKELNLIAWNGKEPKYDIRDWDPEHQKMGKGITLTDAEAKTLIGLLGSDRAPRLCVRVVKALRPARPGTGGSCYIQKGTEGPSYLNSGYERGANRR